MFSQLLGPCTNSHSFLLHSTLSQLHISLQINLDLAELLCWRIALLSSDNILALTGMDWELWYTLHYAVGEPSVTINEMFSDHLFWSVLLTAFWGTICFSRMNFWGEHWQSDSRLWRYENSKSPGCLCGSRNLRLHKRSMTFSKDKIIGLTLITCWYLFYVFKFH